MAAHEMTAEPVGKSHGDRKSTRLNSSHSQISYAVFCLKKKNITPHHTPNNHLRLHLPTSFARLHSALFHAYPRDEDNLNQHENAPVTADLPPHSSTQPS